jgi:hypothetical protein
MAGWWGKRQRSGEDPRYTKLRMRSTLQEPEGEAEVPNRGRE